MSILKRKTKDTKRKLDTAKQKQRKFARCGLLTETIHEGAKIDQLEKDLKKQKKRRVI